MKSVRPWISGNIRAVTAADGFKDDNPLANQANYSVYMNDITKQSELVSYIEGLKHVRLVNQSEEAAKTLGNVNKLVLTRFCFADKPVQYVPIIYSQLVPFLHSGVIDAGVWSADMLPEGLSYYPMPRLDEQEKDTVAVLACRKSDNITAQLVRKILSVERVDHIQQQVMRKQIIPRY